MAPPSAEASSTVKTASERLMSGGSRAMPSRLSSWRKTFSLSVLPMSSVMVAARNSTGWLAFR